MASGRRHWRLRLARLALASDLSRAGRRQLRKLLGRSMACEWRLLGNVRGGVHRDPLSSAIARRVRRDGHVGDRLRRRAEVLEGGR